MTHGQHRRLISAAADRSRATLAASPIIDTASRSRGETPYYLVARFGMDDEDEPARMEHFLRHYLEKLQIRRDRCLFALHSAAQGEEPIEAGGVSCPLTYSPRRRRRNMLPPLSPSQCAYHKFPLLPGAVDLAWCMVDSEPGLAVMEQQCKLRRCVLDLCLTCETHAQGG